MSISRELKTINNNLKIIIRLSPLLQRPITTKNNSKTLGNLILYPDFNQRNFRDKESSLKWRLIFLLLLFPSLIDKGKERKSNGGWMEGQGQLIF
jgi:hypothetical protein